MNIARFPMLEIGGLPTLMKDYLRKDNALKPFYSISPEIDQMIALAKARNVSLEGRSMLVHQLTLQNQQRSNALLERIQSLKNENVFTVTTGHQLCVAGGPLFFIYKIASTIKLSRMINAKQSGVTCLPIFWMASEDHDFQEIQSIQIFGNSITWHSNQTGAVGRFHLDDIQPFLDELNAFGGNNEQLKNAIHQLSQAYTAKSLAEATRNLAYQLFGEKELIVIDADNKGLKQLFAGIMQREISERPSQQLVIATSEKLETLGYKAQVHPREINLFHLTNDKRERIRFEGKYFIASGEINEQDLLDAVQTAPENFSPNVILRPVYQESILPNIAYVGGPGEISYWLQLKDVFRHYGVSFPALVLRDSALILSPASRKKMEKLNLSIQDLFLKPENIIQRWVKESGVHDLSTHREKLQTFYQELAQVIKMVDPTLESSALAEGKKADAGLEHLEKKMIKQLKQKEETRIQQLEKLFAEITPGGAPQERTSNYLQYIEVFQDQAMEELINAFDPLKNEMKVIG